VSFRVFTAQLAQRGSESEFTPPKLAQRGSESGFTPPKLAQRASEGGCDRCGAEMFRMHAVWRCPRCGYKTDCCGW
jgi:hypothetical protein